MPRVHGLGRVEGRRVLHLPRLRIRVEGKVKNRGARDGRGPYRRKVAASGNIRTEQADNGPLFNNRLNGIYPNGDRDCQATKSRISIAACTVQSCRKPKGCAGCTFEGKL